MAANYARIISADSQVIEPPDLWWGPLRERFGDDAPRPVDEYQGRQG